MFSDLLISFAAFYIGIAALTWASKIRITEFKQFITGSLAALVIYGALLGYAFFGPLKAHVTVYFGYANFVLGAMAGLIYSTSTEPDGSNVECLTCATIGFLTGLFCFFASKELDFPRHEELLTLLASLYVGISISLFGNIYIRDQQITQ